MRYLKIVFYLFLILSFTSCTEVVDFDLHDGQERIVVEGSITSETKAHLVRITKTGSYFSNAPAQAVSNAYVTISDGDNVFELKETPLGSGNYYTDSLLAGIPGKSYTLKIEHDGKVYQATSYLKPLATLDSIIVAQLFEPVPFGGGAIDSSFSILMFFQDPPGLGDFYMWHYYINGELQSDTLRKVQFFDDDAVDGNYIGGIVVYKIKQEKIKPADIVTLNMYSISKDYYNFMLSVMLETDWRGSPWDGPPANILSNVSNGAIGFFWAGDVSSKSVVID
jgi:hypothetical protein